MGTNDICYAACSGCVTRGTVQDKRLEALQLLYLALFCCFFFVSPPRPTRALGSVRTYMRWRPDERWQAGHKTNEKANLVTQKVTQKSGQRSISLLPKQYLFALGALWFWQQFRLPLSDVESTLAPPACPMSDCHSCRSIIRLCLVHPINDTRASSRPLKLNFKLQVKRLAKLTGPTKLTCASAALRARMHGDWEVTKKKHSHENYSTDCTR